MSRAILASLACVLLLAACGQPNYGGSYLSRVSAYAPPMAAELMKPDLQADRFSYNHMLALEMARAAISPRYERARQLCLRDASLNCKLLSASINSGGDEQYSFTNATLTVSMPHDGIARFEGALLDPVAGENKGDVVVGSRSTSAENVEQQASDLDKQVSQLTDYRDRLNELLKRPGLSVDDLIKVESELAKVEGDLNPLLSQKRDVSDRIQREQLVVSLSERASAPDALQPIRIAVRNGVQTLGENAGSAVHFLIALVPWVPIIAIAFLILPWAWRSVRRRGSTKA
jgi:hypothetical protein